MFPYKLECEIRMMEKENVFWEKQQRPKQIQKKK